MKGMMQRASCGFVALLACVICSIAQTSTQFASVVTRPAAAQARQFAANETHIQSETTGPFYANSAFAHGYRHGYEQGFHLGDLNIHLGRSSQVVVNSKENSQGGREYRPSFGNKGLFEDGFRAGFHSGYADAISGAEFRASDVAKAASAGLSEVFPNTRRAHFDEGVAAGYKSARSENAPALPMSADYVEQYCRKTFTHAYSLEYCSGFGRGYVLGSSGATPDTSRIATAQKVSR